MDQLGFWIDEGLGSERQETQWHRTMDPPHSQGVPGCEKLTGGWPLHWDAMQRPMCVSPGLLPQALVPSLK